MKKETIALKEKVNFDKLQKVINCCNIPIKSGEEEWGENIKEMLKKYDGNVIYHKNKYGRFFGNGLQSCQRDVRKYLANNNYIDIDIENAHLGFLENLMNHYSIEIPDLLKDYNTNRTIVIEKFKLKDKLYMIKLINNEKCIDQRFKELHNAIYIKLLPKLKEIYNDIPIKKVNGLGSFMATVLQDIENKILMCMYEYCNTVNVKIGVLCFDGFMVEKETYYQELLNELSEKVYLKLNYKIKLTEKSMDTDWEPECKIISKYENVHHKKINKLLKLPYETGWITSAIVNGTKAVPTNCMMCLIDPNKDHINHSNCSLFINNDKSVVKNCSEYGLENINKTDAKKITNYFIVDTQENTIYQGLLQDLLDIALENNYKKEENTGIVYKQVKRYAYIKYLEPQPFLNDIFFNDKAFRGNVNSMKNMIIFMKQYNCPEFPFIITNKDYLGFTNGVFNTITCEFTKEKDFNDDFIVRKYFNHEFTGEFNTPLMDSVLDHQFKSDVRDFIYASLGRLFGIRDTFGFMLYLLGEANTGKSMCIDIISECFNNVGAINDNFEQKFGLAYLYNKDIIICDDLPKNIANVFPQQTFQTICTNGKINIAVKGGASFTEEWKVPLLFAGNWLPNFIDKGQISRRMLVANFETLIPEEKRDISLKSRIIKNELPNLVNKCLVYYKNLLEKDPTKSIIQLCPEYFIEQQQEQKMEQNPLYKFLYENTRYCENKILLMNDIKESFNESIGKKLSKLDNGTFTQVDRRYIIETTMICKSCYKQASLVCCDKYERKNRSTRKIVKNIEFCENK